MVNNAVLLAVSPGGSVGGVAFAFVAGDSKADLRRQAIGKTTVRTAATAVDRTAKKKQIAESLAELEKKKSKRKRANLQTRIEQAGLSLKRQQFLTDLRCGWRRDRAC